MVIGNTKQIKLLGDNIKYEIIDEHLTRLCNMKYLGILIDECLNWDAQYKVVKRKLKRTCRT